MTLAQGKLTKLQIIPIYFPVMNLLRAFVRISEGRIEIHYFRTSKGLHLGARRSHHGGP